MFEPESHFHRILALHEMPDLEWEALSKQIPLLPRGWFELSRLPVEDRVEFTRDYWFAKLPFASPNSCDAEERLEAFFAALESIELYATQSGEKRPFEVHMVYGLEGGRHFHGSPPITSSALSTLKKQFAHVELPADYLGFLQIHDGFNQYTDTGLIKTKSLARTFQHLQQLLSEELLVRPDGQVIEPSNLVPFYESEALHCYQCFYADWHEEGEMGNIYFSESDQAMSNYFDRDRLEENQAFTTFLGWLVHYLRGGDWWIR